jgi:hypothetical protein
MTIDINKKYTTGVGHEVRIYAIDGGGYWPIHGAMKSNDDLGWLSASWEKDGGHHVEAYSLVEAKLRIKQKLWVNVYPDHCCGAYHEKRHADEMAAPHRIGCVQVEIECEEGEGL